MRFEIAEHAKESFGVFGFSALMPLLDRMAPVTASCSMDAAGVQVDRKILSDMAVNDPEAFSKLVEKAESARQTS